MGQRSSYRDSFKAHVVQQCLQPGATRSSVAISQDINANVFADGYHFTETSRQRRCRRSVR